MTTTIQVSDEVRMQLESLKEGWGVKSYDEVIRRMVRVQTKGRESMFGSARGSKPFVRGAEDEHEFVRD